jgi:hypothetical protein
VSRPPKKPLPPAAGLNFLLGASDTDLDSFELARLAEVANLRSELHAILDKLIDEMAQAAVCGWFRQTNRGTLKRAIDTIEAPEAHAAEIIAWAKERIKNGQRSKEELAAPLVPRTSLVPGAAHLAAALRYQQRNNAKGLCAICPQPLDRNSVRFCTRHLEMARARYKPKGAKGNKPGTIAWLYGDGVFESAHGKQPGTVKSITKANEKRKRGGAS